MKRALWILTGALLGGAVGTGSIGFFLPDGYVQGLVGNVAATLLGLAVTILLVNVYLASSEKGAAAAPLLKLITPAVKELHNDLFVGHLKNTFGIEKMRALIDTYQKNKRNPRAYSPEQCDQLYAAIMSKETDLVRIYDILIDQFRELSMITGWSFDPAITAAALEARLNFVKFKTIRVQAASDSDLRYQIVETYLDGEAAAGIVFGRLIRRLGVPEKDWKGDV